MTTLGPLILPEVGSLNTVAEPRVGTALKAIETWANGNVGTGNITAEAVTEAMLAAAVKTLLNAKTAGGETKKSIIATEEERVSATYGTLTTPDEIEIEMPTNGMFAVWYQAQWAQSGATGEKVRAAIFLDAVQLKVAGVTAAETQAAALGTTLGARFHALSSFGGGLASIKESAEASSTGDATTGQAVGLFGTGRQEVGGTLTSAVGGEGSLGGPCWVFAAAKAKYKVSVQFKASAGSVIAKNRKLWVLAYT